MPKFTVEHTSNRPVDETFQAVKQFLSGGEGLQKFDSKAQFNFNDSQKSCQVKGSQFKADMSVSPAGAGSKVAITVDLPLLLTPLKGKVQETLQKMLSKHLA